MFALLARLDRRFALSRTAALLFAFSLVIGIFVHGHVHEAHASHDHGMHHARGLNNVDAHGVDHNTSLAHDALDALSHASGEHEHQIATVDDHAGSQKPFSVDDPASVADHAHPIVCSPPAHYAVEKPTGHGRYRPRLMPAAWSRIPALPERPPRASA